MPLSERFWWIRLVGAAGWALAGLVMLVGGIPLLSYSDSLLWPLLCFGGGAGLLIVAWVSFDGARETRAHILSRRLAFQGDLDAIPTSRIAPVLASATVPDVSMHTLKLIWPRHWFENRVIFHLAYFAWATSLVWITIVGVNLLFSTGAQLPSILTGIGIGSTLASGIVLRSITAPFGKPSRLIATSDGILWEPLIGRARFVRWHQCRLLEVASIHNDTSWSRLEKPARRYTLYTTDSSIAWTESAPVRSSPSGDYAALLALILARTGLSPRTFDRALQPGSEFPAHVVTTVEPVPLPNSPSGVYILAVARSSRQARVVVGVLGALLAGAGIFAAMWALDAVGAIVAPEPVHSLTTWMNGVIAFCLVFAGLVGLLMLIAALNPWARSHPFTIRADATGLTHDGDHIAWDAVTGIARLSLGTRVFYRVMSAADDTTILWPERSVLSRSTPYEGTPVTPAELAAVASARSGKPIRVIQRLRLL